MAARFVCPACFQSAPAHEVDVGKSLRCGKCNAVGSVELIAEAAAGPAVEGWIGEEKSPRKHKRRPRAGPSRKGRTGQAGFVCPACWKTTYYDKAVNVSRVKCRYCRTDEPEKEPSGEAKARFRPGRLLVAMGIGVVCIAMVAGLVIGMGQLHKQAHAARLRELEELAKKAMAEGDALTAIRWADEAIAGVRGDYRATVKWLTLRGDFNFQGQRLEEAVADYTAALRLSPMDAGLYHRRANAHLAIRRRSQNGPEDPQADRDWQQAMLFDPTLRDHPDAKNFKSKR
jgi:tetratricopeptide (TPR) repeat protein